MKTKTRHITSPKSFREKKRAFALVMALGLMAFLVLLVITLAAIVQMELKVNKQAMLDNKARLLAKLAAYQALGEIQKTLGPDQRITANAAILDTTLDKVFDDIQEDDEYEWWTYPLADSSRNSATVRLDNEQIEGIANPYWVGVWDATPGKHPRHRNPSEDATREGYSLRVMESAMTYLVSGNIIRREGSDWSLGYLPDTMLTSDYVNMVRKNSVTDSSGYYNPATMEVRVPLVKLEESPDHPRRTHLEMRYAWWVSDESQKAPLDAVASADEYSAANRHSKFHLQALPFNSGIAALTNPVTGQRLFDINPTDFSVNGSLERVRNLFELQQLNALQTDGGKGSVLASRALFHSVTFGTRGVLVNVRAGGLKKDLTVGLLRTSGTDTNPTYFKRPLGVTGFDLAFDNGGTSSKNRRFTSNNRLDFKGHMFGPQNPENILSTRFTSASYTGGHNDIRGFSDVARDSGGPLWDSLRSYYNSRVTSRTASNEYSNTVRVQTDKDAGLSPVLQHFSMFYIPALRDYSSIAGGAMGDYGVRILMVPIIILWNPYDVPIAPATYAFRLGASSVTSGSGRVAIGYRNGGFFDCIRDHRTEKLPRPMRHEFENLYEGGSIISEIGNKYTQSTYGTSFLPLQNKQLNNYRFVPSAMAPPNSGNNMPLPELSNSSRKITRNMIYGHDFRAYNKTYLGYGPWTESDAKNNPSDIVDDAGIVIVPAGVNNSMGLVRFFKTTPVSFNAPKISDASETVSITYNFAEELPSSFVWRPMYLNDVRYSIARYGQNELYAGGATLSGGTDNTIRGNTTKWDDAPRFLLRNENGLQPGQALIFSFKTMVPYNASHVSANGSNNGYAGVFARATRNQWWMTEGLESNIGGLFIDILHQEAAHFYSTANSYGQTGGQSEAVSYSFHKSNQPWTNLPTNPYASTSGDAQGLYTRKPLGVLFNINEVTNRNGAGLSIGDIMLDFDFQINTPNADTADRDYWMSPYGYQTAGLSWSTATLTGGGSLSSGEQSIHPGTIRGGSSRDTFQFSPLVMWNYADDNDSIDLYALPQGAPSDHEYGKNDRFHFQKLKMFALMKSNSGSMGEHIRSFPDPLATTNEDAGLQNSRGNRFISGSTQADVAIPAPNPAVLGRDGFSLTSIGQWEVLQGRFSGWNSRNEYPIRYPIEPYLERILVKLRADYPDANIASAAALAGLMSNSLGYDPLYGKTIMYEDDSFLLANPRRLSSIRWYYSAENQYFVRNDPAGDNPPKAIQRPIIIVHDNAIPLSELTVNNPTRIAVVEYVGMPRQVNRSNPMHSSSTPWRYQNIFQLPWISQLNVTGKMFGGVSQPIHPGPVDGLFLPYNYAKTPYHDRVSSSFEGHPHLIRVPQSYYGTFEASGQVGEQTTPRMEEFLSVFPETFNDVQVGPNLLDNNAYKYSLRHILQDDEIISNMADLVSAELVFGAEVSSNNSTTDPIGLGVGTNDVLYPTYTIGNSYASYRITPERSFGYVWGDGPNMAPYPASGNQNRMRDYEELSTIRYDIVWHLNEVLWDEYFFSTLPYRNSESGANLTNKDYWLPSNPRLKYVNTNIPEIFYGYANAYVPSTVKDKVNIESDYDMNAARLWIKGPFNVNSTNVDAWKAVLATSFGNTVYAVDQSQRSNSNTAPFPRNGIPYSAEPVSGNGQVLGNEKDYMTGYRALSLDELECLAVSMVENVKDRGPFYSLADFVNRTVELRAAEVRRMHNKGLFDLSEDFYEGTALSEAKNINTDKSEFGNDEYFVMHNHMQKGVIQSAIDMTDINSAFFERPYLINIDEGILNARFENLTNDPMSQAGAFFRMAIRRDGTPAQIQNVYNSIKDPRNVWENWRAGIGSALASAPTYLTQADILKQIGSFITVRGDTFKIRAYGEVKNPLTNIIESKAWCEMIVQRYPEYVDNSMSSPADVENRERELGLQNDAENDTILQDFTDAGTPVNIHLGRRFKVVSFRWLSELEV